MPLGVILKDKNVIEEMITIMDELHKYVHLAETGSGKKYSPIAFGGDYLTAKRAQSAIKVR